MKITIKGQVLSQKNSKKSTYNPYTHRTIVYTEPRIKAWQNDVDAQLLGYGMIKGPVEVSMRIWNKDRRPRDLDNSQTSLLDRLKGVVIEDDNCFILHKISCEFMGVDKENPRAEIEITPVS